MQSWAEAEFLRRWLSEPGLASQELLTEYRFCEERRWRFDFALPQHKVAIEIEGAIWRQGRHTRGSGYTKDLEKYNTATLLGWRVFRFTPDMIKQGWEQIKQMLEQALAEKR